MAVGFLSGFQSPVIYTAIALQTLPTVWRVGTSPAVFYPGDSRWPVIANNLQANNITPELVLSDGWGYQSQGKPAPYANWTAWEQYVKQVADENKGRTIMFDVWNEPDLTWQGTQEQLFETYMHAWTILTQELGPNVIVGGLSESHYDPAYLKAFLDYSVANNVKVNFISWHENTSDTAGIQAIQGHLTDARTNFKNAAAYASLSISQVQINEMVGPGVTYSPAGILAHLNQAELGSADAVMKACWTGSDGQSDCFNNTVDGLAMDSGEPRSAWLTYKMYAQGRPGRVAVTSSDSHFVVMASPANSAGTSAQVLIAYFDPETPGTSLSTQVTLNSAAALPFVSNYNVHVQVQHVADSGQNAAATPNVVYEATLLTSGGAVQFILPAVKAGDLYRVLLTAP